MVSELNRISAFMTQAHDCNLVSKQYAVGRKRQRRLKIGIRDEFARSPKNALFVTPAEAGIQFF
jgi:hypothetical protein